jgi:hypothetical protein
MLSTCTELKALYRRTTVRSPTKDRKTLQEADLVPKGGVLLAPREHKNTTIDVYKIQA